MLHSTLSALLVSVASRYAQLSPSDVGIGIGGGRLVIDNVQLRADTLNGPHIPFHVHQGRAGRLRVNVPWSALSSTPIRVYLENVHLIAGPKPPQPGQSRKSEPSPPKPEWHQTMVGRLLFNVSVEVYGLKVEYRDDNCVGIISIASLRANSAGPDWHHRFLSLASDLNPEQPEASAVSMRKLVQLSGVHWVMIPRRKGAPPASPPSPAAGRPASPRLSERHLDLDSYESKSPILDGITVTVRVLLCTGMALVTDSTSPGLHAEVDIDMEEPSVNLTAQQIKWIDQILKQGLGVANKLPLEHPTHHPVANTRRRPRSLPPGSFSSNGSPQFPEGALNHNESPFEHPATGTETHPAQNTGDAEHLESSLPLARTQSEPGTSPRQSAGGDEKVDPDVVESHAQRDAMSVEQDDENFPNENGNLITDEEETGGGFQTFWEAIVGEYADETVDDAAIALGLENGYASTDDEEELPKEQVEDNVDIQYARGAVDAAAMAGGFTFKLRFKTPDLAAQDKVEQLKHELHEEREKRQNLENVESILSEAEERVKSSESHIEQLQSRNQVLVKELEDLEQMTSQAGKTKDALIRQMEAALMKAENNLQAMYQARYKQQQEDIPEPGHLQGGGLISEPVPAPLEDETTNLPVGLYAEATQTVDGTDPQDVMVPPTNQKNSFETPGVGSGSDESTQAQTQSEVLEETSSSTSEHLSIVDVSSSENAEDTNQDRSNSPTLRSNGGIPTSAEHAFGAEFAEKMTLKQMEQAMSSEGLTLV